MSGDVASFDQTLFKAKLALKLGKDIRPADIKLTLTPASVSVLVEITAPSDASKKASAMAVLTALTADSATASSVLGVTVEKVSSPPIETTAIAPLGDGNRGNGGGGSGSAIAVALGVVGGLLLLCLIAVIYVRRKQRALAKAQDARYGAASGNQASKVQIQRPPEQVQTHPHVDLEAAAACGGARPSQPQAYPQRAPHTVHRQRRPTVDAAGAPIVYLDEVSAPQEEEKRRRRKTRASGGAGNVQVSTASYHADSDRHSWA